MAQSGLCLQPQDIRAPRIPLFLGENEIGRKDPNRSLCGISRVQVELDVVSTTEVYCKNVGMNTILVRFASGGIKKLEHGTVVRLSVEDKFTLSTIYYEFQLLQSEPSEDEVDVEAEETLRFIPKMPQAVLDVPNNTPQSLSDIGLSRLPSVLAALPQHSAQFRPKPAGEPLTPTNTPQTATSQSSNPITPQASVIFTPQTSANPSRAPSIVGDFDLLENDDEGSNTGLLPPLPPPKMTAEQQRILQSTSANDLFLTSDTILKQVQNPLQLHYEQTLQPCEPEVSSDPEDSSDFEASKPTLERQSSIDPKLHLSKEAFAEYQCSLQVETDEEFSEASEPKTEIKDEERPKRKRKRIEYTEGSSFEIDNDIFDGVKQRDTIIVLKPKKKARKADSTAQAKLLSMFKAEEVLTKTLILYDKTCLSHKVPDWHLEQPGRLECIVKGLEAIAEAFPKAELKLQEGKFSQATVEQCCGPHDKNYLEKLNSKVPTSSFQEPIHATQMTQESQPRDEERQDTFISHQSLSAALYASGAVCHAIDVVSSPDADFKSVFCAVRPPGHHAGKSGHTKEVDTQGFCLLNNVAIGAYHALNKYGYKRILIFDFDVHHGNGTEDIVAENKSILFISSYVNKIYPMTGKKQANIPSNVIHIPLPPQVSGKQYRTLFDKTFPKLEEFKPDLVLLSAGFDAHKNDTTKSAKLDLSDFIYITEKFKYLATKYAGGRLVSCLEGGYSLEHLELSVQAHVLGMMKI